MKEETVVYVIGNGFGNIIQTVPAYYYLKEKYRKVVLCTHTKFLKFARAVYGDKVSTCSLNGHRNKRFRSALPGDFKVNGNVSEVEMNLRLVGCENPQDWKRAGGIHAKDLGEEESFDLVICNGYNKRDGNGPAWEVKAYPYWEEVVKGLGDLRIASVGLPGEYVPGTVDKTGIGLESSIDLIYSSEVFASNDTGFYHAASLLKVPTVVVFTMSDQAKNYDPIFHLTAKPLALGLPCQPCQLIKPKYWLEVKGQCGWACRFVHPDEVIKAIREKFNDRYNCNDL